MNNPLQILLIEDDPDDVELLQEAFGEAGVSYSMEVIKDGSLVEPYLQNAKAYPHVIILDFNLPKVHGKDVLKLLKNHTNFKAVPLVILTTSSRQEDIDYSYKYGVDKYIIKPTTMEDIQKMVQTIADLAGK